MTAPLVQILGAGPWQLPVIRRAQSLGLRVLAVDRDADRPGFALADLSAQCDLCDEAGQLALARRFGVQGILAPTTDVGVQAAAAAADALGLPGPGLRAARLATDKAALTRAASRVGLATRLSRELARAEPVPSWNGPCVVKPVDNQSGRGVRRVDVAGELTAAVHHALTHSRCGRVLVDEWLEGDAADALKRFAELSGGIEPQRIENILWNNLARWFPQPSDV